MKIEIHVSEDNQSFSIALDGGAPMTVENFVLLTKEGEKTRNLVFGDSESLGRLIYGLYVNCWRFEETGMRDVLELVAEDIREVRDRREKASDDTVRRLM